MSKDSSNSDLYFQYSQSVSIHYTKSGHGRIPVVFLHGFGASLKSWDDIKSNFKDDSFTLYCIDLKGHGLSSAPEDSSYAITDHSQIIISFIKELKLSNVILVGHSYGGSVAILTALISLKNNNTVNIKNLVLIDPAIFKESIPFFIKMIRSPITRFASFNLFSAKYRAKYVLRRLFFNKEIVDERIIDRYAIYFKNKSINKALVKMANSIIPTNYDSIISAIDLMREKTLIIWGENDPIIPFSDGKRLAEKMQNSNFFVIPSCGHIPQEELPVETYKIISKYLDLQENGIK